METKERKLTKVEQENALVTELVMCGFTLGCIEADIEEQERRVEDFEKFVESESVSNLPISIRGNVYSVLHILEESASQAREAKETFLKNLDDILNKEEIVAKCPQAFVMQANSLTNHVSRETAN